MPRSRASYGGRGRWNASVSERATASEQNDQIWTGQLVIGTEPTAAPNGGSRSG